MATQTARKGTSGEGKASLLDGMAVEDKIEVPLRGRGYDADTIRIREELEAALKDGKARSFPNVTRETRENFARPIRAAAKMKGKEQIKVSTRLDENSGKLYWGPDSVLKNLAGSGEVTEET